MRARIVGLGQAAAGDDGAGLRVIERVRAAGVPPDVEVRCAADPSALIELLKTPARVVLVDAVLAAPAGQVLELDSAALCERGLASVSSHGVSVGQAIALARALDADSISQEIRILAITIARPARHAEGLSAEVAAAVERAAFRALSLSFGASPQQVRDGYLGGSSLADEALADEAGADRAH